MRLTCNPEYSDHWLYKFAKNYLDMGTGRPIRSLSGKRMYFLNLDGVIHLRHTLEEIYNEFGKNVKPKTYTFIAGNVYDNKELLRINPDYVSNLEALDRVQRERLLNGSWHAALEGSGYFQRGNVEVVSPFRVPKRLKTVRAWDLSTTEPSEVNPNPDWTAGVKISLCDDGYFYVEHATKFRHGPHLVAQRIMETAQSDGRGCVISIPRDPGAAGLIAYQAWSRPLIMSGFSVKQATTRKGKLDRFIGFANAVENGMVKVVQGDWNDEYFQQLELFDGGSRTLKDDLVDATSDSYNRLIVGKKLPDKFRFSPSNLTKINTFVGF